MGSIRKFGTRVTRVAAVSLLALMSTNAFAVTVTSATLDVERKYLVLSVIYGGGCSSHQFSLTIGKCTRSFPVRCNSTLRDQTDDRCRALLYNTVVLPLKDYGLDSDYFKGGTLGIQGEGDPSSSVFVNLPG